MLIFINSLVIFFLFLELYSILFYFFFLNNIPSSKTSLLNFKNSLLLYLFNNFLATVTFLIGLNFIIEKFGTTNLVELNYIFTINTNWQEYFLIFSFILKLSLPTIHYLKLEVYKYLNIDSGVFFSVISLYIYFTLLVFFLSNNFIYIIFIHYKLFNIIMLLSLVFFINKLKITNFQEFIAYSGYATNNIILLILLI